MVLHRLWFKGFILSSTARLGTSAAVSWQAPSVWVKLNSRNTVPLGLSLPGQVRETTRRMHGVASSPCSHVGDGLRDTSAYPLCFP